MFQYSLSADREFDRCEQRYYYRNVMKLRSAVRAVAPQRGIILHEYFAAYYKALAGGSKPDKAHQLGIEFALGEHALELKMAESICVATGDEVLAAEIHEMPFVIRRLADRYYLNRGQYDADSYDVLMVEERFEAELAPGIVSIGYVDLVLRERGGLHRTWLTDHKTTKKIPEDRHRTLDLQTLIYKTFLETVTGVAIDGVLWNYLLSVEPSKPSQVTRLKKGQTIPDMSRSQLMTTWDVYKAALLENGLNPADYYEEMVPKLYTELDQFMPRFEKVVMAAPAMLRDYHTRARRAEWLIPQWMDGSATPVRSIGYDCTWCSFYRLCEAALTGGDPQPLIDKNFVIGGQKNGSSQNEEQPRQEPERAEPAQSGSHVAGTSLDQWEL